jgi:hypothetical protein
MRILFINNDGGGFADHIDIAPGTTVQQLFAQRVPHGDAEGYLIRVNRLPTPGDQVLNAGDRVSFTPTRIEGAWGSHTHSGKERQRWLSHGTCDNA